MNTLLISLDDILHYTSVSGSIDPYKINPHIFNAQILYIEPILGSDLYDKIISLVNTNDITGSTWVNYKTLLETYIQPSLIFHTMELFIPLNAFQIADGGTFQFTPSNANFSTIDEIDKISSKYRITGSKYDDKLSKYLCENSEYFSEYISNSGLVARTEVTPRTGWYLGTNNTYTKIRI